jgi:hypothetical protein
MPKAKTKTSEEFEEKGTNMATKKAVSDRVTVNFPLIPGQKKQDDVIFSVNGRTCAIQRGVDVKVKREVYEAILLHNREVSEEEKYLFNVVKE